MANFDDAVKKGTDAAKKGFEAAKEGAEDIQKQTLAAAENVTFYFIFFKLNDTVYICRWCTIDHGRRK